MTMMGSPPPLLGSVSVRAPSPIRPYRLLLSLMLALLLLLCRAGCIDASSISQHKGQELDDAATGKNLNDEDDTSLLNKNNHDRNLSYSNGIQPKLVGGVDLEEPMYPWFAVTAGSILCGASLVAADVVITAGHCAEGLLSGVRLGGIERRGDDQDFYGVDRAVVYPYYEGDASPGDLSLAKLSRPVSDIAPIEIEDAESWPLPGRTMTVLGYGAVEEEGGISDIQQMITLDVVNYASCYDKYGDLIHNALMFCTRSNDNPPKDTCQGDSGGPLFDSATGKLQGVVAFGLGCGRPGMPSVNTRLSAFRDWISDTICELSDVPPSSCGLPADNAPFPTPAPVAPPTRGPVPQPTNQPVPPPTQAPVPLPTKAPVPPPTYPPIPPPTRAPVPPPTNPPVPPPTQAPVPPPTNPPVPPPTQAPVPRPTNRPVVRLTQAPVPPPTTTPVPPPTNQPVPAPTPALVTPTLSTTQEIPTLNPNPVDNGAPTAMVQPAAPTVSPSPPTSAPTGLRATERPSATVLVISATNQTTEAPSSASDNNNALPGAIEDNIKDTSGAASTRYCTYWLLSPITRIIPQSTTCDGAGTVALFGIVASTTLLLLRS